MSLDPMPDAATLLRMKADRERLVPPLRAGHYVHVVGTPPNPPMTLTTYPVQPITLRLPWSALVSDNDKFVAKRRGEKAMMVITEPYATAKERIAQLARDTMGNHAALEVPLSLTARVWFPGGRTNDVTNWCKLVHDALEGIVYTDDRWIHDARWIRAGVDVDAPRCELTIAALLPPTP